MLLIVPSNYNYLPDSSVLKPVIGQLVEAVKSTSGSGRFPPMKVELCLKSLVEAATDRLPPINWAAILSAVSREYPGNVCLDIRNNQYNLSLYYFKKFQ